jgi:hypothetical protein
LHGVVDPVTDVSLVLTSVTTKRSLVLDSIEREGHDPDYETGPRLAAGGQLIVYNPNAAGSKLFRIDTTGKKPKLRLLARKVALEAVDGGRIVGWRGDAQLVTLDSGGRVLATAALSRKATTSVHLDGARLFTTAGNRLSLRSLGGEESRHWPLVDEGGGSPWLVGVEGDLAVYVSGVAVHVLRLSSGADVVLALSGQGPEIDVELTTAGLFYGYDAVYTAKPGRLGFVSLRDLGSLAA